MLKGGLKDRIVRYSVRLHAQSEEFAKSIPKASGIKRSLLVVQHFFVIVRIALLAATMVVFFSSTSSFEYFNNLDEKTGYTKSYSTHRSWQRRIKTSSILSAVFLIGVSIFNGLFFGGEKSFAASYTINCSGTSGSPTSVTESTYGAGDVLTFSDTGGDGYCELDEAIDVGAGSITVETGVVLTHPEEDPDGVNFTASTIIVTGDIDTTGKGCRRGGVGNAHVDAYGPITDTEDANFGDCASLNAGAGDTASSGGGAGHGGQGGRGNDNVYGSAYGDDDQPVLLGSGGGRYYSGSPGYDSRQGGDGGGRISLIASSSLTIDGTLSADGEAPVYTAGGGGSGGSIYISAPTFNGAGSGTAAGGNAGSSQNTGAGGGGRIAAHYSSGTFDVNGLTTVGGDTVHESATTTREGDDGIVWLQDTDEDDVTITSGGEVTISTDLSDDLTISGNLTLTFDAEVTIPGNFIMGPTNTLIVDEPLTVTGDFTANNDGGGTPVGGTIVHTATDIDGVNISAANMTLAEGVTMNTDALGCSGGTSSNSGRGHGPNLSNNGECENGQSGYGSGAGDGGGGGHGGLGGESTSGNEGATYGDNTAPSYLGSGGGRGYSGNPGYTTWPGGDGGGLVRLNVASTLTLDGVITADGEIGNSDRGGSGSGGSVYLTATTLAGSGSITAHGADTAGGDSGVGAGGGGRVALEYVSATFDTAGSVDVTGGENAAGASNKQGGDGTLYELSLTAPSQPSVTGPSNGTYNQGVNPTLTSSTYSSNGLSHTSSTWTVSTDSGGSNVVWQASNNTSNLTSIVVNSSNGSFQGDRDGETTLDSNTQYYVTVVHNNGAGSSSTSSATSFTTAFTGTTTTDDWDFSESSEYEFTSSNVEFNAGQVRLKDVGGGAYRVRGLSSWDKRVPITITNSNASELTDFQVRLTVTYDSDMQSDFDDLRFTSNGITQIDHWVGAKTDSSTAEVYVEVPTLAASGDTTIYMHYDNDAAASASSGEDTFYWYDDFETFTGWSDPPSDSGNFSQSSAQAYTGTYSGIKENNGDPNGGRREMDVTVDRNNWMLEYSAYRDSGTSHDRVGLENDNSSADDEKGYGVDYVHSSGGSVYVDQRDATGDADAYEQDTSVSSLQNQWYIGQLILTSSDVTARIRNSSYVQQGESVHSNTDLTEFHYVYVRGGNPYYVDDIRVRKYAATEPSASFGSEANVDAQSNLRVKPSESGTRPLYDTLFSFTETRPEGNAGNVLYQISNDGTNWYYHDGSSWTTASSDDNTNTASTINNYLPSFTTDVGTGSFYYRAFLDSDGTQQVALSNIELKFNKNPVASTISTQELTEDTNVTGKFDLDSFFTDAGDNLTYTVLDGFDSGLGTMTVNPDGTVDFDLAANANGSDTIQFRATDQTGATVDSNSVTINLAAVNDAPSVSITPSDSTPNEDSSSVTLTASASDPEDDSLTYTWVETLDASDACSLNDASASAPDVTLANKDSNYSCEYRVTVDDGSDSAQEIVSFNVTADNDAPTITTITDKEVNEGQQLSFVVDSDDPDSTPELSALDSDGDFAANDITVSDLFTDNEDGTGVFSWQPQSDEAGTYVAQFRADDSNTTVNQLVTITVNDSVNDAENSSPQFGDTRLPNVSFAAGVRTTVLFDLDDYFSDADDETLTYSVTGNERVEVFIDEEGQVTMEAPASFAGSEAFNFVAQDRVGDTATSNAVIVTVTETIPESDINHVIGKAKGKGIITIKDNDGNEVAQWQAFKKGGVVPRLETVQDNTYIFAVKKKSGSTTHAYTSQGTILKKKRLSPKLHFRKMATGQLDDNKKNVEIAIATKRGNTVYFKLFSFNPDKKRYVLRKRTKYTGIKGKKYRITVQKKRIKLINKKGKTKFIWKPFK